MCDKRGCSPECNPLCIGQFDPFVCRCPVDLLETFPIVATAGFETGIVPIMKVKGVIDRDEARVDWGDGTDPTAALFKDCNRILGKNIGECTIVGTHIYENAGTYNVTFIPASNSCRISAQATVVPPRDFVILSIGDSVASGEGNPVTPAIDQFEPAQWDDIASNAPYGKEADKKCHRSSRSGPALAAQKVLQTNPNSSFVHRACSGAKLNDREQNLIQQLEEARRKLSRVDVLIISGGANNVAGGFGSVVEACAGVPPVTGACCTDGECKDDVPLRKCQDAKRTVETDFMGPGTVCQQVDCDNDNQTRWDDQESSCNNASYERLLLNSITGLDSIYGELADAINCVTKDGAVLPECLAMEHPIPSLVLIAEYFDPTHDKDGNFPQYATNARCTAGAISNDEWEFLYDTMMIPLNREVKKAAQTHGWALADGIANAFLKHGMCAQDDTWVVQIPESIGSQFNLGDSTQLAGTGHPNAPGQACYGNRIHETLICNNPPRTIATGTAGGLPFVFGSESKSEVLVSLAATNPIKESGVGTTYYSIDDPACAKDAVTNCLTYSEPIRITAPGCHIVNYFSENNVVEWQAGSCVDAACTCRRDEKPESCRGVEPMRSVTVCIAE